MKSFETNIDGVVVVHPEVYEDERGLFTETYSEKKYKELGINENFVQDNFSLSIKGTLRGLHYQLKYPQAKLVRVLKGEVFDVAVDLRKGSPTYGDYFSIKLNETNLYQLYMPIGIAHGFYALSDYAYFEYKCSDYYHPNDQHGVLWNDQTIAIDWPIEGNFILSEADSNFKTLNDKDPSELPNFTINR